MCYALLSVSLLRYNWCCVCVLGGEALWLPCHFLHPLPNDQRGIEDLFYLYNDPSYFQDMLNVVREQRPTYNNAVASSSQLISQVKLLYYRLFMALYQLTGTCVDLVMVNGSWTESHMRNIWWFKRERIVKVFPPCNTEFWKHCRTNTSEMTAREGEDSDEYVMVKAESNVATAAPITVVSLGQFRPEKDHILQVRCALRLVQSVSDHCLQSISPLFGVISSVRDSLLFLSTLY